MPDARRAASCRRRDGGGACARSQCPASLKGVLTARRSGGRAGRRLPLGRVPSATSCRSPTVARGRSTCSTASGRGARRARRVRARASSARWLLLADGTAVVEAAQAIPLDPDASSTSARASSRGLGELIARGRHGRARARRRARRHGERWTAAPGCSRCSPSCRCRRASPATSRRARSTRRGCSARRRARRPRTSPSSSARSRRRAERRELARLRRGGRSRRGARRRSAPSSCRAPSSSST